MEEKTICDIFKRGQRLFVVRKDRAAGNVAACHDQDIRPAGCAVQQQCVERCVGKHYAKPGAEAEQIESLSDAFISGSGMSGVFFRQQYDGPLRSGEKSLFCRCDLADPAGGFQGTTHERQRFFRTVLSFPQFFNGLRVQGVTGKMDAADAFYGQDAAGCKELLRAAKCIVSADRCIL